MGCGSSTAAVAKPPAAAPSAVPARPTTSAAPSNEPKKPFAQCYDLREQLGSGQYATVHRALSKKDGSVVAVKCIKKSRLTKEDLEALNVEVEAMKLLKGHPNFVQYYDFFAERDYFFVVMELISGGELFNRIVEKEKYSEREARTLIAQLAGAINAAHAKRIAHRDLKPENILLKSKDDDTTIKLADLGFAKIMSSPGQLMNTPCGTPGYVAPEVISGKPYGLPCDIWSLGVIIYILLCGYPPFDADDQAVLFKQIKTADFKFDPAEWGVITDGAKDLVRKLLVVDPAKRLTASQIVDHPWMKLDAAKLPEVNLDATRTAMKRFNARRKLRAAMRAVRATVRARMMMLAKVSKEAKAQGREIDGFEELAKIAAVSPPTLPTPLPRPAAVAFNGAAPQFAMNNLVPPVSSPRPTGGSGGGVGGAASAMRLFVGANPVSAS